MGKKVLIVLGVIVIIVAAALFFLISNIDAIVKKGIEQYGSEATGTNVGVSSVRLSLKKGEGSIGGLRIGNPKGFSPSSAFELGGITVAIDTGSVTKDPVIIEKVQVTAPHVVYEIDKEGKANFDKIKENLGLSQSKKETSKTEKAGEGKNIVIKNLIIEKGEVEIRIAALGDKPLSSSLPTIRLTNLGGDKGASPSEIARQILGPLTNRVVDSVSKAGIQKYLGKSTEEVKKMLDAGKGKLGTVGKDAAKEAEGALKKIFGK